MTENRKPDLSKEGSGSTPLIEITYYTDPLCPWSWGFEPQWRRLRYEYEGKIGWRYRMGGMIASWQNYSDPLNDITRPLQMGPLCRQVKHVTGMPVHDFVWVENPPTSSFPACVAVKAAELQSRDVAEQYLRKVREAVMLECRNVARKEVLSELAERLSNEGQVDLDVERFKRDLKGEQALEMFREDLREAARLDIGRFPTLTLQTAERQPLMIVGYRPYEVLLEAVRELEPRLTPSRGIGEAKTYSTYWGGLTPREVLEIDGGGTPAGSEVG